MSDVPKPSDGITSGPRGLPASVEAYRKIKFVVFDVDGVLSDGRIVLDSNGVESKFFDVRDGSGISIMRKVGYMVAFLTGRNSPVVDVRARELHIPPARVRQGAKVKLPVFKEMLMEAGVTAAETVYVGDDIIDRPVLEVAGIACCPGDAHDDAREVCHIVASARGGRGAARQIIEHLLKSRQDGTWETARGRYLGQIPDGAA
jgi:3-deoxy-D-manno-octulosonate 8-phosphate phosphatase (KDO 8-P phosphatase)